jgi:hypothetical protein
LYCGGRNSQLQRAEFAAKGKKSYGWVCRGAVRARGVLVDSAEVFAGWGDVV